MLKGMKATLRESRDLGRLLSMPAAERPIVFYAEDTFTHVQYEGYLNALLTQHEVPVKYVTSAADDPLLTASDPLLEAFYIDKQLPRLMERLDSAVVAMTMPDLGQYQVPVPPAGATTYIFHSLNSTHTAYRTGAFDHYDEFFCTGPHHVEEIAALRRHRGLPRPKLHEVGYYKLDRIIESHAGYEKRHPEVPTVLIAPSWGPANLLDAHGSEVIRPLLDLGVRVVVRPHPQFFHSLYPEGAGVVRRLQDEFGSHPLVEFELSIDTEDSFHEADVMVSDWSGAAFEYALGTLRPVLFIDTPQKVFNEEAGAIGLSSLERYLRDPVGAVLEPPRLASLGEVAAELVGSANEWGIELERLRADIVFNVGQSALSGAAIVASTARNVADR